MRKGRGQSPDPSPAHDYNQFPKIRPRAAREQLHGADFFLDRLTAQAAFDPKLSIAGEMVANLFIAYPILHDPNADQHYGSISAFIKSMRGSDSSASTHRLANLPHGEEDPRYITRRLVIHAPEDCNLAVNAAPQTAVAAMRAVQHIGYPEAQIVLAHVALQYLPSSRVQLGMSRHRSGHG